MKIVTTILPALCAIVLCSCASEQENRFYKMTNASGMEVTVTNFGGRITSIVLPDKDGVKRDVVLGFDKVEDYYPENNQTDFGASIGRYANRINQGKFSIDSVEYDLPKNNFGHCLHGGPTGWQYQPYKVVEADSRHIKLRMDSPEGDNNFPGAVTAFVTYTLTDDCKIDIAYEATSSAPTIINIFLEAYDFSGKKIVLFATSGGSGFGKAVAGLQTSAPKATIVEGSLLNGRPNEAKLKAFADKY